MALFFHGHSVLCVWPASCNWFWLFTDECAIEFCCQCSVVHTTCCLVSLVVKLGVICRQLQMSLTWCHGIYCHHLKLRLPSYFAYVCWRRLAMRRTTLLGSVFITLVALCDTCKWPRAGCRIRSMHFLAGWRKMRPEPDFSFVRFSFAYVCNFH